MGHSSFLITTRDVKFVFDPCFSNNICFVNRDQPAVYDPIELHDVQVIVLSNANKNRFDIRSLKFFKQNTQMIVPSGMGESLKIEFDSRITEMADSAETSVGHNKIIAYQSLYTGFKNLFSSRINSLNYILKNTDMTLFYCSESKYEGVYFYDLGKKHNIDVAIIPIDHVCPDFLAGKRFMSMSKAIQTCLDLNAKVMIPCSYGAFNFSKRVYEEELEKLNTEIEKFGVRDRIKVLQPGEIYEYPQS